MEVIKRLVSHKLEPKHSGSLAVGYCDFSAVCYTQVCLRLVLLRLAYGFSLWFGAGRGGLDLDLGDFVNKAINIF